MRVGLEDNIYLSRGVLAGNGDLVERAVQILDAMNVRILGPRGDAREAGADPALSACPGAQAVCWLSLKARRPASESSVMP